MGTIISLSSPMSSWHDVYILELLHNKYEQIPESKTILSSFIQEGIPQKEVYVVGNQQLDPLIMEAVKQMQAIQHMYTVQKQKRMDALPIWQEIESRLGPILVDMEVKGIYINPSILETIASTLKTNMESLQKEIYLHAGKEFNILSSKQTAHILKDVIGIPLQEKTKTGYSMSSETLLSLEHIHPIVKYIRLYRKYSQILSHYILGLIKYIHPHTKRIHPQFFQIGTVTGRITTKNPNVQNIPLHIEETQNDIREAFLAKEGFLLMVCDYSQIELRVLAYLSHDQNLIQAFQEGKDIHLHTAQKLFGKETISFEERQKAKTINFSILYGMSAFSLSKILHISKKEAEAFIASFFQTYPQVQGFFEHIVTTCKKQGYVETPFGRKRYIPHIASKNTHIENSAKREAINMVIQGTAADIIKKAMIEIDTFFKHHKYHSSMILQIHDSLILEIPEYEKDAMLSSLPHIMKHILQAPFPWNVKVGIGKNWKEAEEQAFIV